MRKIEKISSGGRRAIKPLNQPSFGQELLFGNSFLGVRLSIDFGTGVVTRKKDTVSSAS